MNLITYEGLAMIDTNNVIHLRRVHYACPVERPERPTWRDWFTVITAYVIGACLICAGFMAGAWIAGELITAAERIDWHAIGQLLGVMR